MKVHPVILCGGSGTRLWPLSTSDRPKQFLEFQEGYTLFDFAVGRIAHHNLPTIVCSSETSKHVALRLRKMQMRARRIIVEPVGRNTAAAIALAATDILVESPKAEDGIMVIMPSDHYVEDVVAFKKAVEEAIKLAEDNYIVCLGAKPTHPHTGYGYILRENIPLSYKNIPSIRKFKEKPSKDLAECYVSQGYLWNTGIFVTKATVIMNELEKYYPDIHVCSINAYTNATRLDTMVYPEESFFKDAPSVPIDKAVMEHTNSGAVVEVDCGWKDLGNWKAMWEFMYKDENGNHIQAEGVVKNSSDSYILSDKPVICVGVNNMIIVDTRNGLLIINKDDSEKLGDLIKEM